MKNLKSIEECNEMAEKIHAKAKELEELAHQAEDEFGLHVGLIERYDLRDSTKKSIRMRIYMRFHKVEGEE